MRSGCCSEYIGFLLQVHMREPSEFGVIFVWFAPLTRFASELRMIKIHNG
jgi:hypothetical protein